MKFLIKESSLNKLIDFYLDSLRIKTYIHHDEIFVNDKSDEYRGLFYYEYSENELSIEPFLISTVSSLFNMDRGQAMEGIAIWFENKFDVVVLSAREWDW